MALQGWDKNYREELKIQQEVIESLQQQLMISGEGGSPGQPYTPPKEDPKNPYVPAPGRKLAANNIRRTGGPLGENDDGYGENPTPGHPDWQLAHGEGRGPQPQYHDEYNRELPIPPWMQMDPSGKLIEIPWMKEQYLQEHPEAGLQISGMNYPPPSELDKWLQLYQRNGGSLRHLDPDLRRLILQRGTMKADAANNIRSLQSSGHQTVLDDNRPGHLKIIKQFKPPRA